jgi:hypothetical protein
MTAEIITSCFGDEEGQDTADFIQPPPRRPATRRTGSHRESAHRSPAASPPPAAPIPDAGRYPRRRRPVKRGLHGIWLFPAAVGLDDQHVDRISAQCLGETRAAVCRRHQRIKQPDGQPPRVLFPPAADLEQPVGVQMRAWQTAEGVPTSSAAAAGRSAAVPAPRARRKRQPGHWRCRSYRGSPRTTAGTGADGAVPAPSAYGNAINTRFRPGGFRHVSRLSEYWTVVTRQIPALPTVNHNQQAY